MTQTMDESPDLVRYITVSITSPETDGSRPAHLHAPPAVVAGIGWKRCEGRAANASRLASSGQEGAPVHRSLPSSHERSWQVSSTSKSCSSTSRSIRCGPPRRHDGLSSRRHRDRRARERQLRDRGFLGPVLKHDLYQRTVWLVPLPGSPPGAKVVS